MARNVEHVAVSIVFETLGSERNTLIECYMIANNASFAYDDTRTMIDGKLLADGSTGMDVDARL